MFLVKEYQEQFEEFAINQLLDNSRTNFDLFVKIDAHFVLYSGVHYKWERDELSALLGLGRENFWIKRKDRPRVRSYQTMNLLPKINNDLAPGERIQSIEQVGMHLVKAFHEEGFHPDCLQAAEEVGKSLANCMLEDVTCIKELSGLGDFDLYTYYHSIRVASYAVAINILMGKRQPEDLGLVSLGSILHDLGKKEIDSLVLNKAGPLTNAEWEIMKSHPVLGYKLIEESLPFHVCREIILHHHEKLNGSGYPHGLGKTSLLDEVQIATIADIFDALTSSRNYQHKRSRFEALHFIKTRMVPNEVAIEPFKALIACFGGKDEI